MKNPYIRVLLCVMALFLLWLGTGAACDTDTEEYVGVRVEDKTGKVQLTTNEGWTDASQFADQAAKDAKDDLENIAQGVGDGISAVAEQAQRYPSQSNPTGQTCASPCDKKEMRKACRDRNESFNACLCRCESK